MTAPFTTSADSLAAAAVAEAAAASAAAAAAAAPDEAIPDDTDRIDIVNSKPNVMDDHIVGVDAATVVVPSADPHTHHPDVDRRKPEHPHHVSESDPAPVANGEPDSDSVSLHVVVAHHDPSVDDHRDNSDDRVVDSVPDLPVNVPPDHNHQPALQETQHHLDAQVEEAIVAATAQEPDSHHHMAEILPASTPTVLHPPPPVVQQLQPPTKKKRKTYNNEEERRKARILKNRRTAEESRQRRMKRMKELEDYAARASVREKELQEEVRLVKEELQQITESMRSVVEEKNAEIAQKDAEIQRLQDKLAIK